MGLSRLDPVEPSQQDVELAKTASIRLGSAIRGGRKVMLEEERQGQPAERFEIPAGAVPLIQSLLSSLAQGRAVAVIPIDAELTTQQAADFLGVSRPFVVGLIESNQLPARKVNTHRRVAFKDLVQFKRTTMDARQRALADLTAEAQEDGEY